MTEAIRQKMLHVLFVFGLILIGAAHFFTQFSAIDHAKFLKDIGYAAISWTGLLMALMCAAQMIPAEIERRTIYTILSKPVRTWEFITGKYLGLVGVLLLAMVVMGILFAGVMFWSEARMIVAGPEKPFELVTGDNTDHVTRIHRAFRDPALIQAWVLVATRLCVVAAIALTFSTIATSTTFIISLTLLVYFIGHMQEVAHQIWSAGGMSLLKKSFLALVGALVPNFNIYSVIDDVIAGHPIFWKQTSEIMLYSGVYVVVLLAVSTFLMSEREW